MRLKRMLIALLTVTALGVSAAGSAQAAGWKIEGEKWTTTESVKAKTHEKLPPILHLDEVLTTKLTLWATGFECIGCTITKGTTASAGKLRLTGVSVYINEVSAPKCTVNGGTTLETAALKDEAVMDTSFPGSEVVFDKFSPVIGTTFFTIEFTGNECLLAKEVLSVKGTLCGEMAETEGGAWKPVKTNELRKVQTLLFDGAPQATGGCELRITEKKDALLESDVDTELSGSNAGKPWGVG